MNKSSALERVSKSIMRVLGLNPGPFTLQGTNTYVIGQGERRLLVDTGDGSQPDYYSLLKSYLGSSRIDRILLTHWHGDHIGGLNRLLQMSDIVAPGCKVYKRHSADADKQPSVQDMLSLAIQRGCLYDIADRQIFAVDDLSLQAVFTPGHTVDHMAFTVLSESGRLDARDSNGSDPLLITGDLILGQGTTVVSELQSYMESLDRVLSIHPIALLPGHGPIISGRACVPGSTEPGEFNSILVISEYIRHRNMRQQQILDVLARPPPASSTRGWYLEDITRAVYTDISDPRVILAAQNNTLLHLRKLLAESIV
ncbi:Beta-lactamase-like protein 2, partial [Coemansia sp. RSA 2320]